MALDKSYVVTSDIDTYFVNKDNGLPLANGRLYFYRDIARTVPKPVYQLTGSPPSYNYTAFPNPIILSNVGTVQNSGGDNELIYYFPYETDPDNPDEEILDLYYIVCTDENGNEQFTREAWPNLVAENAITTDNIQRENQLSNPTFTNVFLNPGIVTTFAVSGSNQVFPLGPNWDFVLSGNGSVSVQQVVVTGNDKINSSPAFVLDVQTGVGITNCFLRQRFPYNSGLWASTADFNVYLAGSFVARNQGAGTTNVSMFYEESTGGSPIQIVSGSVTSGDYQFISGSTTDPIPQSSNTDSGEDGYIDIYLSFTAGSEVRVSSIQVIPSVGAALLSVPLDLNSSNRDEAFQGDYYIPRLNEKPISSYLVGWDFPLNPFQFASSSSINTNANYIVDQTISQAGNTGNVAWGIDPVTDGIRFNTAGTNDAFYILQYLEGSTVQNMIGNKLSVNVFGYQIGTGNAVTMRVYLFRGSSSATFPSINGTNQTIGNLLSTGIYTLDTIRGANWSEIPRSGLPASQTIMNQVNDNSDINNSKNDYGFSGWEITDSTQIGDTDKFAIVITFQYPIPSTQITINSISLVPGDIPCRPAIQSVDEVLKQCEYYYEKSYNTDVFAGTAIGANRIIALQTFSPFSPASATNRSVYPAPFSLVYRNIKRVPPSVQLYSPSTGAGGTVVSFLSNQGLSTINPAETTVSSNWVTTANTKSFLYLVSGTSGSLNTPSSQVDIGLSAAIAYHYVLDARIGII